MRFTINYNKTYSFGKNKRKENIYVYKFLLDIQLVVLLFTFTLRRSNVSVILLIFRWLNFSSLIITEFVHEFLDLYIFY